MPVDKNISNAYLWYSGATDVTGKKLAEALGMKHGDKKPSTKDVCMAIGWGVKTKEPISFVGIPTLNHPDSIAQNRNKLASLKLMLDAGVNVAPFIDVAHANSIGIKGCPVFLPVIGRTNFHQGGKGFWNCPTPTHVRAAIDEGAGYFQNLIEIKDEFRLHTFGDKVIYAVKKTKRSTEEMEEAFIKHEMDQQESLAAKNGNVMDKATMEVMLRRQAKKFAQDGANMLIRSNRLGWKFIRVKSIDKALEEQAVKALKAIGLDFGAVDCCVDAAGKPWVIEVNSGPGLEESTFDAWVEAFRTSITNILQPPPDKATMPKGTVIDIPKMVKGKEATLGGKKQDLIDRVKLMSELAAAADEEEASVLGSLFRKIFN